MAEFTLREADVLEARANIARSFERLQKTIAKVPERIKQIEAQRDEAYTRVKEVEELLARERVITEQRHSLSESAKEEVRQLHAKIKDHEKNAAHFGETLQRKEEVITELEAQLAAFRSEIGQKDADTQRLNDELRSSQVISEELLAKLDSLQEANARLQEQCLRYESEVNEFSERDASFALRLTDTQRRSLVDTIDMAISKIDALSAKHATHSH
jgi:chromosome segregation ATPase